MSGSPDRRPRRRVREWQKATMSIGHLHPPGVFDAGHCRTCARQAELLDHYLRVQGEEARLRQASTDARTAHQR
jgi:hypothetical protein